MVTKIDEKSRVYLTLYGNTCNALMNATLSEDKSVLKFGDDRPAFLPPKMLVREAYIKLHNCIDTDPATSALITGNPGIGKSFFSFYELFCLFHDLVRKKSKGIIVYESIPEDLFLVLNAEKVVEACNLSDRRVKRELRSIPKPGQDHSYYLFDAGTYRMVSPQCTKCKSIVFSLPNEDNYNDYLKQNKFMLRLYMPVWSLKELKLLQEVVNAWLPSPRKGVNVDDRFELFGGIPRCVFNLMYEERDIDITMSGIRAFPRPQLVITDGDGEQNYMVFHFLVDTTTFQDYSIGFASRCVAKKYFEQLEKGVVCSPPVILTQWRGVKDLIPARGLLFEIWAHKQLVKGGDFTIRCLETGEVTQLQLLPMESASFSNLQELKEHHSYGSNEAFYLQPSGSDFVAIDSLAGDKLFQMTVARQHPLKTSDLNKSLQAIDPPPLGHFNLYFVVPDDVFNDPDAFKGKQSYFTDQTASKVPLLVENIRQYVLCLPLKPIVRKFPWL